jgi:hypothetical protein
MRRRSVERYRRRLSTFAKSRRTNFVVGTRRRHSIQADQSHQVLWKHHQTGEITTNLYYITVSIKYWF